MFRSMLGFPILVLSALQSVAAVCNTQGTSLTLKTPYGTSCLCHSRWSDAGCTTQNTEPACDNVPTLSGPVTDGIIYDVSYTATQMTLVVSSSMTDSRKYDSIVLDGCSAANYVATTSTSIASTDCQDRITLVVDVVDLYAVCGLSVATSLFPDNYIKRSYTGSITLNMRENYLDAQEVLTERSFNQVLGFAADYSTGILVPDVIESHTNSPLGLYAAVSNLDTTPSTHAVVDVTFFMTYPLHVSSWTSVLTKTGTDVLLGAATVVSAVGTTSCTNPTDYTPVCTKSIQIQIAYGTACSLNGNYKIPSISIDCATGIDALDCPLTVPDTSSWFAFDIALPSLCDDTGFDEAHDDVVAITSFNTVWTDPNVPETAFVFGGQMNFVAGFSGVAVQSIALSSLTNNMSATEFQPTATTNGFTVGTQKAYFSHPITLSFVGGTEPAIGTSIGLTLTVNFLVEFDTTARRRRRRILASGQKLSEITTATILPRGTTDEADGVQILEDVSDKPISSPPPNTNTLLGDKEAAGLLISAVAILITLIFFTLATMMLVRLLRYRRSFNRNQAQDVVLYGPPSDEDSSAMMDRLSRVWSMRDSGSVMHNSACGMHEQSKDRNVKSNDGVTLSPDQSTPSKDGVREESLVGTTTEFTAHQERQSVENDRTTGLGDTNTQPVAEANNTGTQFAAKSTTKPKKETEGPERLDDLMAIDVDGPDGTES